MNEIADGRQTGHRDPLGFLAGGGEMARRIREFDWSKTPLGSIQEWPQSLKTSVGIILGAEPPVGIYWGADLILLYNDSWRDLIGDKHPGALGRPSREVFPEIWEEIAPMFDQVISGRGAAAVQNKLLSLNRNERLEDVWFDFSFNPIPDESGRIAGIFNFATETTEKMLADRALRESEARFRALVTASADVVYRMGPDWSEMRQLLGRDFIADTQEPSSNWLLRYIPAEDHPQVMAVIDGAIRNRSTFEMEHRVLRPNGSVGWTFSRAVPILNERGEIVEWFGMAKDVTDRKRTEEAMRQSEERLTAILEQLPHGVGVIDTEGRFILTNSVMRGFVDTSMPSRDPAQRARWRAVDAEGRPVPPENWPGARALRGEAVLPGLELVFTDKKGRTHWIQVSAVPFRTEEGEIAGAITVAQDISESKETEEALREAKSAAEGASRAKSEFLANMSHEIRTPMTVFIAAIEHLLQIDRDAERRHMLGLADQSTKRLRALIDDILDFSRIEARKVDIEEESFDLRQCLREAVAMFTLSAREKNLKLETNVAADIPEKVEGDLNRVFQILINLIGNAVKFTQGGEVRVCVQPRGDVLEFSVADTGIGIPESKRHLLFESFSQVDMSFHRRHEGSGLGLAISKGLVELMGGEISVRSREGQGSVFTFTLPLKTAAKSSPETPGASPEEYHEQLAGLRILMAEDEPLIREMITMMLEKRGLQAETAETGREALQKWEEDPFDLILMDLQMPEMDGMEATQSIREKEKGTETHTCIIGLTAHVGCEVKKKCLASGMDRVLLKPVQMKDLFSVIEECFLD